MYIRKVRLIVISKERNKKKIKKVLKIIYKIQLLITTNQKSETYFAFRETQQYNTILALWSLLKISIHYSNSIYKFLIVHNLIVMLKLFWFLIMIMFTITSFKSVFIILPIKINNFNFEYFSFSNKVPENSDFVREI